MSTTINDVAAPARVERPNAQVGPSGYVSNWTQLVRRAKRALARRIFGSLKYWAVDAGSGPLDTVARLRLRGMRIGHGVVIYDTFFDPLYPELISIGDHVTITGAIILVHDDAPILFANQRRVAPVSIGGRCFIGRGSVILPGVQIGNDCIIGAGSVVTRDVPDGQVVGGNPARLIATIGEYRGKLATSDDLLPTTVTSNLIPYDEEREMKRAIRERYRPDLL